MPETIGYDNQTIDIINQMKASGMDLKSISSFLRDQGIDDKVIQDVAKIYDTPEKQDISEVTSASTDINYKSENPYDDDFVDKVEPNKESVNQEITPTVQVNQISETEATPTDMESIVSKMIFSGMSKESALQGVEGVNKKLVSDAWDKLENIKGESTTKVLPDGVPTKPEVAEEPIKPWTPPFGVYNQSTEQIEQEPIDPGSFINKAGISPTQAAYPEVTEITPEDQKKLDNYALGQKASNTKAEIGNLDFTNAQMVWEDLELANEEQKEKFRESYHEVNRKIVESLKRQGIDVVGVANSITDPIETKDGPTSYGDIVYREPDGTKRIVKESAFENIKASAGEIIGGVVGGVGTGMALGATGANPLTITFGGLIGGGLAAATGNLVDKARHALTQKQKLDAKMVALQFLDAGIADMAFSGLTIGGAKIGKEIIKGGYKTAKELTKALLHPVKQGEKAGKVIKDLRNILMTKMDNPSDALKLVKKKLDVTNDYLTKRVNEHNTIFNRTLDPTKPEDVIRVLVEEGEDRLVETIGKSVPLAETSGVGLSKTINKELVDMKDSLKTGAKGSGIDYNLRAKSIKVGRDLSNYITTVEEGADKLITQAVDEGLPPVSWKEEELVGDLIAKLNDDITYTRADEIVKFNNDMKQIARTGTADAVKEATAKGAQDVAATKEAKELIKQQQSMNIDAIRIMKAADNSEYVEATNKIKREIDELSLAKEPGYKELIDGKRRELREMARVDKELKAELTERSAEKSQVRNIINDNWKKKLLEVKTDAEGLPDEIVKGTNRNFYQLLDYVKKLSSMERDPLYTKNVNVSKTLRIAKNRAINKAKEIAIKYMGERDGLAWWKSYKEGRAAWANYIEFKESEIVSELLKDKGSNYPDIIKAAKKSLGTMDRSYAQVWDQLTDAQRANLDKAVLNNLLDEHTNKATKSIQWEDLREASKGMEFRSPEAKAHIKAINTYADTVGNRADLAGQLQSSEVKSTATGIGTDIRAKGEQQLVNTTFRALRGRLGLFQGDKMIALTNTIARILDNPLDSRSVKEYLKLVEPVMEKEESMSMVKQLQQSVHLRGDTRRYSDNTKVYGNIQEGKIVTIDEFGNRVLSASEQQAKGVGDLVPFKVSVDSIADREVLKEILGRPFKKSDLGDPNFWDLMEKANKIGVNLHKKTSKITMAPYWEP